MMPVYKVIRQRYDQVYVEAKDVQLAHEAAAALDFVPAEEQVTSLALLQHEIGWIEADGHTIHDADDILQHADAKDEP